MFFFYCYRIYYIYFLFAWSRSGNLLIPKTRTFTPENGCNSRNGNDLFLLSACDTQRFHRSHTDQTVLSENLCPHRVIVTTIVTQPKWAWPSPLGINFTGVQCRPWSNGTIVILTDPRWPILRCFYDFVQWLILWEHEECATGFEEIIWMSSFCQVAKSEWEPELYLCVHSSKFRKVSSGESS